MYQLSLNYPRIPGQSTLQGAISSHCVATLHQTFNTMHTNIYIFIYSKKAITK